MSIGENFESQHLSLNLKSIASTIGQLAESHRGDCLSLLALLRMLESIHQEIRDSLFQESLPDNRQALYNLLKDIESSGGWPYIHRMKLQALLVNLPVPLGDNLPPEDDNLPNAIGAQEIENEEFKK